METAQNTIERGSSSPVDSTSIVGHAPIDAYTYTDLSVSEKFNPVFIDQ